MTVLRLGDVVTCLDCGATAVAHQLGSYEWREGDAVTFTWTNGPHPRHEAMRRRPDRCTWCHERSLGWPSVMSRPLASETFVVSGPRETYEIPHLSRKTGEALSSIDISLTTCADSQVPTPSVDRGPCADGVQHRDRGTTRPDTTVGFKAPVSTRGQLDLFGGAL